MQTIYSDSINIIAPWAIAHGIRIIVIFAGALIVRQFAHIFIDKIIRKAVVSRRFATKEAEKKREDTLIRILDGTFEVMLWLTVAMMALSEIGVNIGPLLAGAGIVGLAFGFGGQYLIRDVIAGLFMILENQFRVGDVVCLDSTCGLVEDISLRKTTLRDMDGTVHHVPNGSVAKTSNLSKDFAQVNLNIGVSYSADLDHVIAVVNKVGRDLAEAPGWKERIIDPPQFLRVDDFADSAVTIKILGKTAPLAQWDVVGELRKRLKIAFDKEGIEIPFPQRVVRTVRS